MGNCGGCDGNCASCSGCGKQLELSVQEISFLNLLEQIPFLPVARRADDMTPVYLEETGEDYSLILACLEKKGLVDLDYHTPLGGFDYSAYKAYPLRGSMALTQRGQQVVELLELQGAQPEE